MNQQYSAQAFEFNVAPVMKLYMESLEAWKRNYEALAGNAGNVLSAYSTDHTKTAYDTAAGGLQKSGEDMFKRFVAQQIELCRFFAGRWEQYLKLPGQLASCHTPADLGQLQVAFLNRAANDYVNETGQLSKPMTDLLSQGASPRHG